MSLELGGWALGFVVLACLFSGFAHGAIGFGFPIVATPLVALVVDIKSAIALIAPLTLALVLISALRGGGVARILRDFWPLLAGAAVGAWLGTRLLIAAPPEPFILVLAIAILLYLNLDRLGRGTSPAVQRRPVGFGVAFGFAAGVFEALANVAGPILLIYFMLLGLAPAQIVQTLNLCFSVGKGAQTLTLATSAAMTLGFWLLIGALALPSIAALFAGMRVRHRIDAATYRRWLRGALWVMALLLIGQFSGKALASGEALFKAIESGDERAAERMVLSGSEDIDARNAERETPLHRAVEKGMNSLARAGAARRRSALALEERRNRAAPCDVASGARAGRSSARRRRRCESAQRGWRIGPDVGLPDGSPGRRAAPARTRRGPQRKGLEGQPAAACGGRWRLPGARPAAAAAHRGPRRQEPRRPESGRLRAQPWP